MAEVQVCYDLEFRFAHGDSLYVTAVEGRDTIQDVHPCTHCGRPGLVKVTVHEASGAVSTVTIHTDKLNGSTSTRREEQPGPASVRLAGDTILELT